MSSSSAASHSGLPAVVLETLNAAVSRHDAAKLLRSPYLSDNAAWAKDIASCPLLASAATKARVFFLANALNPESINRVLTDVPAIATSGDRHIVLQNGEHTAAVCVQLSGLLSWQERRRARKRAIVSLEKAYGHGGFRCPSVSFPSPRWISLISVAGAQFEMRYLEARDFIISPDEDEEMARMQAAAREPEPLFPHYYPRDERLGEFSGRKPSWEWVAKTASKETLAALDIIPVPDTKWHDDEGRETFLFGAAYQRSLVEDLYLVLKSFDDWLEENTGAAEGKDGLPSLPSQGWLQLPMVGLGFFASYLMRYQLTPLLIPRFIKGLRAALEIGPDPDHPGSKPWRHLRVLELCDFTSSGSFKIADPASLSSSPSAAAPVAGREPSAFINGVAVVHGLKRGLLDVSDAAWATFTVGIVNAGDAFCLPGNEYGYCSVEAMLGENTSIRRGQSYLLNPWLLLNKDIEGEKSRHIPIKSPLQLS